MKIIILPDEGEYALVPKVATDDMLEQASESSDMAFELVNEELQAIHAAMIAAAPPCKVVELPERGLAQRLRAILDRHADEIARRAK